MTASVHEARYGDAAAIQRYWDANYERLLNEYREEFVAVRLPSGEIVAHRSGLPALIDDLRARGLTTDEVAIEFISSRAGSLSL